MFRIMTRSNTYAEQYSRLLTTATDAASAIQSGDVVAVSGGASQPVAFLEALGKRRDLHRVKVFTWMTLMPPDFLVRQYVAKQGSLTFERNIALQSFCVGPGARKGAQSGVVDVVPVNSRSIGRMLLERRVDVLVVGSSGMDMEGNLNLACNVDWMPDLLSGSDQTDTLVIAEVNPCLPWTEGETTFRVESVDHILECDRPIPDVPQATPAPEARAIGGHLAQLVPDGAILHLGMGELVGQACVHLDVKRDLGVHSDYIGDAFLHLYEKGALTSRRKTFMPGEWVGSFVLGTNRLYEFVNKNSLVALYPLDFVAHPANIMRNHKMVSITQASQVDVAGQVAGQTGAYEFVSNPGIQHGFHVAAADSPKGRGIVILPSSSLSGKDSNIVPAISAGAAVTIPRADVDCVVTEFGVAQLRGKPLPERVLSLIAVAHPVHRDRLARESQRLGLL